ncbi:PTS sugar transporter subunit IIA [bacterium]|nr:PTS sugar transporter subunit IIA [bacterium]
MKLKELIPPEHICLDVQATSPEEVINILVDVLADAGAIIGKDEIKKSVLKRENQVGTGIGFGVAIPHAEPGPFPKPLAAFVRLAKPVDFRAPDKQKANLVFLLLSPDENPALHVRLLARICRLTRSEDLRSELCKAKTAEMAAQKIAELESDYPELSA